MYTNDIFKISNRGFTRTTPLNMIGACNTRKF